MNELVISLMEQNEITEAIRVLSLAMLRNPLHVAVFKGKDEEACRGLDYIHYALFNDSPGVVFLGKINKEVVGVLRMKSCPDSQVFIEKDDKKVLRLSLYNRRLNSLGRKILNRLVLKDKTTRVYHWYKTWGNHHPSEPHWYLGPFGVLPSHQGTGIGTALMQRFCSEVNACKAAAYLVTDLPKNVYFYQKYGFQVIDEADIFSVNNYFMWRSAVL